VIGRHKFSVGKKFWNWKFSTFNNDIFRKFSTFNNDIFRKFSTFNNDIFRKFSTFNNDIFGKFSVRGKFSGYIVMLGITNFLEPLSPGLIFFRKRFLMGLYKGGLYTGGLIYMGAYIHGGLYTWGLIYMGAYTWTIFCVSVLNRE
jgi:hypothetical protein